MAVPPPLPVGENSTEIQGSVENWDFPVSTENQGATPGVVPAARRKRGTRVHTVGGLNYYREPRGKMLPDGIGRRLPDDRDEAANRARELDTLCVPWRYRPATPDAATAHLRKQVDEVTADVLISARKRAKRTGLPFALTAEDLTALMRLQEYRCAVSGLEFRAETGRAAGSYRGAYRPSLDRIKAKLGYVPGNVRFVLVAVNVAMSDWGDAVLIEVARAIAAKHPSTGGQP